MFIKVAASAPPPDATLDNGGTLGEYLQEARLAQGLDLSVIAEETRINLKNLIALEDNNRAALPADVFARGFVKLYAAHLKIDAQEALRLYERQWGGEGSFADPLAKPRTPASRAWSGIVMILLLIAVFFGVRVYYPVRPPLPDQKADAPGSHQATPTADDGYEIVPAPAPGLDQSPLAPSSPSPANDGEGSAETPRPAPDQAEETTVAADSTPNLTDKASTPPYEIRLQATEKKTVMLSLDGQAAVEKKLQPGSVQTWQATKGFELILYSSTGVALTVNGVPESIKREAGKPVTIRRP